MIPNNYNVCACVRAYVRVCVWFYVKMYHSTFPTELVDHTLMTGTWYNKRDVVCTRWEDSYNAWHGMWSNRIAQNSKVQLNAFILVTRISFHFNQHFYLIAKSKTSIKTWSH